MSVLPQTSFIPKKSLTPAPTGISREGMSLFMIGALLFFVLAVASSVGVFLYQNILKSQIESRMADLERTKGAFEPSVIQELRRLDKRIEVAKILLDRHIAASTLFDTLQRSTVQSLRFEAMTLSSANEKGDLSVLIKGQAKSYASVAYQSDILGKTKGIKNPVFSDLNLDQRGNVVFNLKALVGADFLNYKNTVSIPDNTLPVTTP